MKKIGQSYRNLSRQSAGGEMLFELTKVEQFLAKYVARTRYENARQSGIVDQKKGDQSCEETDLDGFAAELLFARIFNLYPDLSESSEIADGITKKGHTYDVKVTKYKKGHLLAGIHKKNKPCDFYVLFIGSFPRYQIAGFGDRDSLLSEAMVKDFGKGPVYAMSQDDPKFKQFKKTSAV